MYGARFPLETTIAVTRMFLSGVWDRWTELTVLLAHSGGTLPFLAGRLESCIAHDSSLKKQGKLEKRRDLWDVLRKNILLDAVVYSAVGLRAAVESTGVERVLFGEFGRSYAPQLHSSACSFCCDFVHEPELAVSNTNGNPKRFRSRVSQEPCALV